MSKRMNRLCITLKTKGRQNVRRVIKMCRSRQNGWRFKNAKIESSSTSSTSSIFWMRTFLKKFSANSRLLKKTKINQLQHFLKIPPVSKCVPRQNMWVSSKRLEILKREKFYIGFIMDDRDSVVNHARTLGFTVFQLAPGNF